MRKLKIQIKGDNPKGPYIDVMECPMCGGFRESVDIDFKRWRYCHKDQVRWCIGDNRELGGGSDMSAERWHAIVDRVYKYRAVEVTESGELKCVVEASASDAKPEAPADEEEDATKLLTPEIRKRLPKLYATENDKDPVVQVKFFSPWMNWTWYVTEFDGEDIFFGLVEGFATEWGYFSLSEIQAGRGPFGVPVVERDLYFRPARISEVTDGKHRKE
ncbi:MAG: DUF2958 domain-containing protein [Phycisphaerae bacterium]